MTEELEPFTFAQIDFNDKPMMDRLYRLRYQVYCEECHFIKPQDYPNGKESDEFDPQSRHFAAFDSTGEVIGTVRLILPHPRPLPIQHHCPDLKIGDASKIQKLQFGEISRLIISKCLRRRQNDGMFYEPQVADQHTISLTGHQFLRRAKPMAFGLYRELYKESKRLWITHWYTLMEKSLWLLLRIHGFSFTCIGKEVDVYGSVRPYLGKISQIEEEVEKKFPKFFQFFSSDVDLRHLDG